MNIYKWFALVSSMFVLSAVARSPSENYLATFKTTATGTNDLGKLESSGLPGKALVQLCQLGDGFATKGLALVYDASFEQLNVVNVTNQNVECFFFRFESIGAPVVSADGTQRRRLMTIRLTDDTFVGTAVFVERFKFDDMQAQTDYSLQATLQILLPSDADSVLGSDRPIIMTGKLTAHKKLSP